MKYHILEHQQFSNPFFWFWGGVNDKQSSFQLISCQFIFTSQIKLLILLIILSQNFMLYHIIYMICCASYVFWYFSNNDVKSRDCSAIEILTIDNWWYRLHSDFDILWSSKLKSYFILLIGNQWLQLCWQHYLHCTAMR